MTRLSLLFLLLLSGGMASAQGGGAQFSFTEKVHDFGKILIDSPASYTFEFTNSGNAPLIITGIQPSCHCISVNWSRGAIEPGGKGWVEAKYAPPIDPRFYRTLLIASNATNVDPSLMRYELGLKGEGVKELPRKKTTSRTKSRPHQRK